MYNLKKYSAVILIFLLLPANVFFLCRFARMPLSKSHETVQKRDMNTQSAANNIIPGYQHLFCKDGFALEVEEENPHEKFALTAARHAIFFSNANEILSLAYADSADNADNFSFSINKNSGFELEYRDMRVYDWNRDLIFDYMIDIANNKKYISLSAKWLPCNSFDSKSKTAFAANGLKYRWNLNCWEPLPLKK